MFIGSLLREADEAVGIFKQWDGTWSAILHGCVDGSHQWCSEWESDLHTYRVTAVIETYQALLNDYQNQLVENYWYDQWVKAEAAV